MEGNLLYSQSTDLNVNLMKKIPSQKHVECLTKYVGTVSGLANLTVKLIITYVSRN